jgi:hypothetical protein
MAEHPGSPILERHLVDIAHVISTVVVANLASGPVHAFDLDHFIVLDGAD